MSEHKAEPHAHAAHGKAKKFVVLHTRVGHEHGRGDVVTADRIGGDERLPVLLREGAVREAHAEEANLERVTLLGDAAEPGKSDSHERRVAQLRQDIEKLQAELVEAQGALNDERQKKATAEAKESPQAVTEVVRAKDQRIRELEQENAQLKAAAGEETEAAKSRRTRKE